MTCMIADTFQTGILRTHCNVVKDLIPIQDFNATVLHLHVTDHTTLTHRFQGRDSRLADAHCEVLKEILS